MRNDKGLSFVSGTRGQESRRRAFLLPFILVKAAAPMPTLEALNTAMANLRAFAVMNGIERPIQVGDVVAQGTLVGSGADASCDIPEASYGLAGRSEGRASITLQITADCQLVVASIDVARDELQGTTSALDSMHPHAADSPGERTFVTAGPDSD